MEAMMVVQHQHVGAEDTHVVEQIMELPEQNTYMTACGGAKLKDT
jgi:hypothetical protein